MKQLKNNLGAIIFIILLIVALGYDIYTAYSCISIGGTTVQGIMFYECISNSNIT